ncbi:MAG: hypothetical protein M0P39_03755 [Rhodocyclaceae bacterium]|nr:hypothetical protein [Rhodocyclaceae bacterium]
MLIATLVILVIITLSSIAMMVTMQAGISASGNIAFRQAATRTGDVAIDNALAQINTLIGAGTAGTAMNADSSAAAPFRYYATMNAANAGCTTDGSAVFLPRTYRFSDDIDGADTFPCAAKFSSAPAGYTLYYVVHRMAAAAGACPTVGCMAPVVAASGGSAPTSGVSQDVEAAQTTSSSTANNLVYYRITVKVSGPRQNNRYLQAFVY